MSTDEPAPKKSMTLWFVLGGVGVALVTCCCCLPGGGYFYWDYTKKATAAERQKKVDEEAGTAVTSLELSKAYLDNPANADAKFKDKVLVVTGRVILSDEKSVTLQPATIGNKITVGGVYCAFADKNKSQLATVKLNDDVKIKGFCTGISFLTVGNLLYCKKVN